MRFYEDGRFDVVFVSHGPGCDDVSIYRPFWRIDLDLDGPEDDEVWLFEDAQWKQIGEEFETFPIVKDLSPEGHKLATFDGDLHYRWSMKRTDPLGCLLYTSDAADERSSVDLGGRRIIKKKKTHHIIEHN